MAEAGGASNGPKYLVLSVLGIIAILVVVSNLGLNPKKVSGGAFSVEFQDGVPKSPSKGESPSSEDTAKLEARLRELEGKLREGTLPQTPPPQGESGESAPVSPQTRIRNVAGTWRSDPLSVIITQNGSQAVVQVWAYGMITAAGTGTLNGSNLSVSYLNNLYMQGSMSATLSADGQTLNVTDYGKGFPQSAVFYRAR